MQKNAKARILRLAKASRALLTAFTTVEVKWEKKAGVELTRAGTEAQPGARHEKKRRWRRHAWGIFRMAGEHFCNVVAL